MTVMADVNCEPYLAAFELLRGSSEKKYILDACRRLFVHSDEYIISKHTKEFSAREVELMATMIFEFCTDWSGEVAYRDVELDVGNKFMGGRVAYGEYACYDSDDLVYGSRIHTEKSTATKPFTIDEIEEYLVALWYRYRTCDHIEEFFSFASVCKCVDAYSVLEARDWHGQASIESFALRVMYSFKGLDRAVPDTDQECGTI
jgi:hypothetical protein